MNFLFFRKEQQSFSSRLYDQTTFYEALLKDLETCEEELIIETPSITTYRMYDFIAIFKKLLERDVRIYVFTKDPKVLSKDKSAEAHVANKWLSDNGIQVFKSERGNNRRLVMVDRKILWEGSLEPLSQEKSLEFMRRIEDPKTVKETAKFLNYRVVVN